MYTGPHLIKDSLVFGYDTGYGIEQHSSTRHYKGEPATNLITAGIPGYFGSGGETLYRSNYYGLNSDSGVFQRNFVNNPATANTSAFNNNAGLYKNFTTAALSSNTEYVLVSFDFYMITPYVRHSSSGTGLNGYMRIEYTDGTASSPGWNTSLNTPNAGDDWNNNSAYIGKWRKVALYVQVNSSKTPSAITHMYIYNDRTVTGEGIFTNFIITEHATVPTGPVLYTSGTRSSTESLINLTGTTDIDVSNVSFDSTGQPDFDGSSDFMSLGNFDLRPGFTLETVCYPHSIPFAVWGQGPTIANRGLHIISTSTSRSFVYGMYGNDCDYSYIPTTNAWHHWVFTYNGTSFEKTFFADGVEQTPVGNTAENEWVEGSSMLRLGTNYGSGTSYGKANGAIAVAKIYNRPLTATEIKQNFNAYKNRFGI